MSDRTVDEDGATAMERWNPASLYAPNDFSQVVRVGKGVPGSTVFVSGQFAGDREGRIAGKTMREQMKASFANLRRAIESAGATPDQGE